MAYPIIGITTNNGKLDHKRDGVLVSRPYVDAIIQAGGIPLLIPSGLKSAVLSDLANNLNGLLLTGGGDVSPDRFGSGSHPKISLIDEARDALEFEILDLMNKYKKPFLGICRGFQVINIFFGGNLYTHISDQMPGANQHDFHSGHPRNFLAHEVRVDDHSELLKVLGQTTLQVNSLHHQGVKVIPSALKAVAWSPDGLVEGLELTGYPFGLAVQWHPEELTDQPAMGNLFEGLIEAAGKSELTK